MITINIAGGLGNQLFQYATARSLAYKNNRRLNLDISFYSNVPKNDTVRDFKIDNFNINVNKINKIKRYRFIKFIYRLVFRPFNSDVQIFIFNMLLKLNIPIFLTRNFQKEKYFLDIRKILLEDLSLKNKISDKILNIKKKIDENISISLHIRRGDYLEKIDYFGNCNIDYYTKSIKIFQEKFEDCFFFIFSDDIDWVKENLKISSNYMYVSEYKLEDYEELFLMSKCKHNIIANSTFSWWGAWLNKNNDKIVIAPEYWFKNKKSTELEILPKKWIQLKNN